MNPTGATFFPIKIIHSRSQCIHSMAVCAVGPRWCVQRQKWNWEGGGTLPAPSSASNIRERKPVHTCIHTYIHTYPGTINRHHTYMHTINRHQTKRINNSSTMTKQARVQITSGTNKENASGVRLKNNLELWESWNTTPDVFVAPFCVTGLARIGLYTHEGTTQTGANNTTHIYLVPVHNITAKVSQSCSTIKGHLPEE